MEIVRITQRPIINYKPFPRERVVTVAELYPAIDAWLEESCEPVSVYDAVTGEFRFKREPSKTEIERRRIQKKLESIRTPVSTYESPHVALFDLPPPITDFSDAFVKTDARQANAYLFEMTGQSVLPRLYTESETSGDCGIVAVALAQGISYKESADFLVDAGLVSMEEKTLGAVAMDGLDLLLRRSDYQAVSFDEVSGLPPVRLMDLYDSGWLLRESSAIVQLDLGDVPNLCHVLAWTGRYFEGDFMPPGDTPVKRVYRKFNPRAPQEHHFKEGELRSVSEVIAAYKKVTQRQRVVKPMRTTPITGRYGGASVLWESAKTVIR